MGSPPRRFAIVMMGVLALTACKRRNETSGAAGDPAPAPATATAPASTAAAPAPDTAAHDAAAALPWVTGPACAADGNLDAVLGVPCLYSWATPAGPTPLAMLIEDRETLRLVAELDGARSLLVHESDINVARGTSLHLRPQPDQRLAVVLVEDWSEDGTEPETANAWLLSRSGKTIEVTPLDRKKKPWPDWASATQPPVAATAGPAAARMSLPGPLPGCTAGLTSPEQVCECVAKLPREDHRSLGGEYCTVRDTEVDSAKIGVVNQEFENLHFVMHRLGAGWSALFILGWDSSGGGITTALSLVASQAKTFGSRQALWIEVERVDLDKEERPDVKAETVRSLILCLVGEAVEPSCVLDVPLFGEERRGRLPDGIWGTPADPMDYIDELPVVSSYRLRVDVSDDGKATITRAKGEPPEDVRRLLGTHTLW